jgi:hypothetical protein
MPSTAPDPAAPAADPSDGGEAPADGTDDNDTKSLAKDIATQLAIDLGPIGSPVTQGILGALSAAEHVHPGSGGSKLHRFVETVVNIVHGSIDLGKHRGDGQLATGSKEWRQRFVHAHQFFLHQLVPYSTRLDLWNTSAGRQTRSRLPSSADEAFEAALSYLVVTRCIPAAVQAAITEAYPPQLPTPGESEALAAVEADDFSRLDSIALRNIRYLAGKWHQGWQAPP